MALHEGFVQRARAGGVKLLFLGDSLTMQWLLQQAGRDEREPLLHTLAIYCTAHNDCTKPATWRLQLMSV